MSLLHPRHVTPFVMGPHKSDERDRRAIPLNILCSRRLTLQDVHVNKNLSSVHAAN